MSTQRNSTASLSRRRHVAAAIVAVIAPVAASIAACSADSPTSPAAATPAPALVTPLAPAPTPKSSPTDALNRESTSQITTQAATFHTQPSDQESGTDRPLPLMCAVSGHWTVSNVIGPNGGTLWFGPSSLSIPKGALSSNVMISATVTLGQGVTVDFAPHGLKFAKAVTITANYAGCSMPQNAPGMNVYYMNDYGGIAQSMPTANEPNAHVVTALTDHFSGYMMAWGRY